MSRHVSAHSLRERAGRLLRRRSPAGRMTMDDLSAVVQLSSLTDAYLPWSSSAISPVTAARLCNELAINGRRTVVEFGPGVSTLVMAAWAEKARQPLTIVAFEENLAWIEVLSEQLNTGDYASVRFVHAPLSSPGQEYPMAVRRWYSANADDLPDAPIDLVVVDGPSAYQPQWMYDRYPALPFVREYLSSRCAIVLDDSRRPGEAAIVQAWKASLSADWAVDRHLDAAWFTRGARWTV